MPTEFDPHNSPSNVSLPKAMAISAGRKALGPNMAADASQDELVEAGKTRMSKMAVGSAVLALAGIGVGEVGAQYAAHQADKATLGMERFNEGFIPQPHPNMIVNTGRDANGNIQIVGQSK